MKKKVFRELYKEEVKETAKVKEETTKAKKPITKKEGK